MIDQTTRRHIPLDRLQILNSSDSLYMSRNVYRDICSTIVVCVLYYKLEHFVYNKFVLQEDWNEAMQLEIRRRRDQTDMVRKLELDFRQFLSAIRS